MTNAPDVIEAEGLTKRYPRTQRLALDGVSLRVGRGVWCSLLGPNGSGKSTLMRIIATIELPSSGSVRVLGYDGGREAVGVRSRIGVVFQSVSLDRLLSVRENLRLQGALCGLAPQESARRISSLGEELGIADRLDQRVSALSGGLARRADLARALMSEPELLLLDEPTAGLDPSARRAFLEVLEARVANGLTVVLSTHLFDEAERGGLVAMLHEGRIVALGSPAKLRGGGEATLLTDAGWHDLLAGEGLEVSVSGHELRARGPAGDLARVGERIVRGGGRVTLGHTTLGDVYSERTGAAEGVV